MLELIIGKGRQLHVCMQVMVHGDTALAIAPPYQCMRAGYVLERALNNITNDIASAIIILFLTCHAS